MPTPLAPTGRKDVWFAGIKGVPLVGDRWDPQGESRGVVLLLPGGGQTRHSWQHTGRRLARAGWTAITIDSRGHGNSGWAPDADYTIDAFVGDLYAVVDALGEPPILVGASLGGVTSMIAEGERPGTARALVLVDVTPSLNAEGVERIRAFMHSAPNGFATLDEVADAVQAFSPERDRPRRLEGLRKNVRLHRDGRWHWHWDPGFMQFGEKDSQAITAARRHAAVTTIQIPTLLVWGTRSEIVTPEAAQELLDLIPGSEVVDVRAGHMVAGDDNDVFTQSLNSYLDAKFPVEGCVGNQPS